MTPEKSAPEASLANANAFSEANEVSEAKPQAFGSAISAPLLQEIIQASASPVLHAVIAETTKRQQYYQTRVCCPCGHEDGCDVKLRFRSSEKSEWSGKWTPTWKEIPSEG